MADETRTDVETGDTTRTMTIAASERLDAEQRKVAAEHIKHTIAANTSLDYVVGDIEDALRTKRWQPENGDQILAEIERLRTLVAWPTKPVQTIAVVGIRVGRLCAEALAKHQWPIVAHGRARRGEKRVAGIGRGKQISAEATRHDPAIKRYVKRWKSSDELKDQYGYRSPVNYVRVKTGLDTRTIQRSIARQSLSKTRQ